MKEIIFFRSDRRFRSSREEMFKCLSDWKKMNITTIDVGDNYQEISYCFDRFEKEISKLLGYVQYDREIYLCGAVPLGFVWLLRGFLNSRFKEVKFTWLQMEQKKGKDSEEKFYQIWDDF